MEWVNSKARAGSQNLRLSHNSVEPSWVRAGGVLPFLGLISPFFDVERFLDLKEQQSGPMKGHGVFGEGGEFK